MAKEKEECKERGSKEKKNSKCIEEGMGTDEEVVAEGVGMEGGREVDRKKKRVKLINTWKPIPRQSKHHVRSTCPPPPHTHTYISFSPSSLRFYSACCLCAVWSEVLFLQCSGLILKGSSYSTGWPFVNRHMSFRKV